MWLLLNESLSLGQVAARPRAWPCGLAWSSRRAAPARAANCAGRTRALVLLGVVLRDIVRSNFSVARIVLGLARGREVRSGFVKIPLDLHGPARARRARRHRHVDARHRLGRTSTPTTSTLTLHVLDLQDEAEWIDWIKDRYERLLMEIFE